MYVWSILAHMLRQILLIPSSKVSFISNKTLLASPQTPPAGPQIPPAVPQTPLSGPHTPLDKWMDGHTDRVRGEYKGRFYANFDLNPSHKS